ncbi:HepT-like ribonuclease domain-containing protein [Neorhizobium sp. LjRoot104]|uniref:HepT-like ribonuclease domain-containing protein n=1 Tax=Neorhizobium sp. LjRoot104 TaxID=3342254 RepID=UPI003ED0D1B1
MPREVRHFLYDIRQTISIIEDATAGKSFADYSGDPILKLGLERAVEIISEASRGIPDDLKTSRPEIPWPKIRGIGNVLRHEYHGLSDKIIWGVIVDEIPKLRLAIEAILRMVEAP